MGRMVVLLTSPATRGPGTEPNDLWGGPKFGMLVSQNAIYNRTYHTKLDRTGSARLPRYCTGTVPAPVPGRLTGTGTVTRQQARGALMRVTVTYTHRTQVLQYGWTPAHTPISACRASPVRVTPLALRSAARYKARCRANSLP